MTFNQKTDANDFELILNALAEEAQDIDIYLANRIKEISKWIQSHKLGLLLSRPFVVVFLKQLIADSEIHLGLYGASNEEKNSLLAKLAKSNAKKYWHEELFPRWLRKKDNRMTIWKNKLMQGQFAADDNYVNEFVNIIKKNKNSKRSEGYKESKKQPPSIKP